MTGPQIIVLATPVFLLLISVEFMVGWTRGRATYRLNDALSSIGLGIMSQLTGVFTKLITVGIYSAAFARFAACQLPATKVWVWVGALLAYDLCYYWQHRLSHTCALLWASHVVHHQSEDYNLSTALRQTSGSWPVSWIFYLPMALLGVPPAVFATVALIDLLYQYWVHTQQIGRLGWFDRWFCSPSNHRVHHAVNDRYLDRNYGGILLVWDRVFGSFQEEVASDPCIYGTRSPLRSWDPLWANLQVYWELAQDSWHAASWADKLRVWLRHPGWRPADVAARWPKPRFELARVERYDPPLSRPAAWVAASLFGLLLGAAGIFLWDAHRLALPEQLGAAAAIVAGLWAVGRISTPNSAAGRGSAARPAAHSAAVTSSCSDRRRD